MKQRGFSAYCKRRKYLFIQLPVSLLFSICLISCASYTSGATKETIVGEWEGIGMYSGSRASFDGNGSCRLIYGGDYEVLSGSWTYKDGEYRLTQPEDQEGEYRRAMINSEGKLIISLVDDPPDMGWAFQRKGVKPPIPEQVPKSLAGEWRYAFTSKSRIPAYSPSPFDVITFAADGKVELKSSAARKTFTKNYSLSGKTLSIITGEGFMPSLDFTYRFEDNGNKLVFGMANAEHTPFIMEWTYLKPDQFLPNDLPGAWVGKIPDDNMTEEITFGSDGIYSRTLFAADGKILRRNNTQKKDYYRLWKAPFGNAITFVMFDESMSSQMSSLWKYEKQSDEIIITPVELMEDGKLKLHEEEKHSLKLKKTP